MLQGTILPSEMSGAVQREIVRRLDDFPCLPMRFLPLTAPVFAAPGFGKMPKARAAQKVRKKSRIKGGRHKWHPPESHRPAVRVVSRASGLWDVGVCRGHI